MKCQAQTNDRRLYRRFKAPYNAFAVLHANSIIVTSLADINMAGLSFDYMIEDGECLQGVKELDIFCADDDFYDFHLQNVPFEIISKTKVMNNDKLNVVTTRYGVKFGKLTADQDSRLRFFIKYHTLGDIEGGEAPVYGNIKGGRSIFDRLSFVF